MSASSMDLSPAAEPAIEDLKNALQMLHGARVQLQMLPKAGREHHGAAGARQSIFAADQRILSAIRKIEQIGKFPGLGGAR